jgi:hypothetical protein
MYIIRTKYPWANMSHTVNIRVYLIKYCMRCGGADCEFSWRYSYGKYK